MRRALMIPCLTVALSMVWSLPASAQSPSGATSLKQCRTIADAAARLQCYDTLADTVSDAVASKSFRPFDPVKDFGGHFDDKTGKQTEELDVLESTITSATESYNGLRFTIATGATWVQTDGRDLIFAAKPGTPVQIKRAAMGSFFARIGKSRGIRVKRVR